PEEFNGWHLRGTVDEYSPAVTMMDHQTLTVDWGDGTAPTVISDVLPGYEFDLSHGYPDVQATYNIQLSDVDDDTGSDTVFVSAQISLANLTIHDGQTNAAVDDQDEATGGAYTVANQNDTDGDGWIDDTEEDWFQGRGVGTAIGQNEKDLMKLIIDKPTNYVAGTSVTITLTERGRSMRLWNESTRQNVWLDGTIDPNETPSRGLQFGAGEN